jgi:uncharacterized protein
MSSRLIKISVDDIPTSPKEVEFSAEIGLPGDARQGDFRFPPSLDIKLIYYRSGRQLFFQGSFTGNFEARCSRCLSEHRFRLHKNFDFVLTPAVPTPEKKVEELSHEDLGLSYYSTDEIELTPLILEQVLLALPTRALCDENCRGLCGTCGANLNQETCSCSAVPNDPRMAIFRSLKLGR